MKKLMMHRDKQRGISSSLSLFGQGYFEQGGGWFLVASKLSNVNSLKETKYGSSLTVLSGVLVWDCKQNPWRTEQIQVK